MSSFFKCNNTQLKYNFILCNAFWNAFDKILKLKEPIGAQHTWDSWKLMIGQEFIFLLIPGKEWPQ